jgi:glycogen operon protein
MSGSAEIFNFAGRRPSASVNMLAVHDGFTLLDLVSYLDKHNEANGEHNRDGHNNNQSWNCGAEGPTDDPAINAARKRDVRALLATLFLSRGTPLIQQGDEMGRTQQGNNNAYAQDNEITWVDWENADGALVDFVAAAYRFRKAHPALTHDHFLTGQTKNGVRDVAWLHPDGREMTEGDWRDAGASVLGVHLQTPADEVLLWFNRKIDPVRAKLPPGDWEIGFDSDADSQPGLEGGILNLQPRSVVALIRATIPGQQPQETPVRQPQETPVQNPPEGPPQPRPDQVPGNPPQELPDNKPGEGTPEE